MRTLWAVAVVAAALANLAVPAGPVSTLAAGDPVCHPRTTPPPAGVTTVGRRAVDTRVTDLTLLSAAMRRAVHVDVLLPARYDASGRTRYPVLYLLHGATGSYRDWVAQGDVERLAGDRPLIVVMPDDSGNGSYSDWYGTNVGDGDTAPAWETFHIGELVPYINRSYPTRADRGGRAIAGLSSGGHGAMKYAARHPELFAAAGEFSGAVDTDLDDPLYPLGSTLLGLAGLVPGNGPSTICTWGDPLTQGVTWRGSDPTYLAPNLGPVALFLATGNGLPGAHDASVDPVSVLTTAVAGLIEAVVWQMNRSFVAALDAAGVPHTDDFYGDGVHSWPYWQDDLRLFLPWMAQRLGDTAVVPRTFAYRSAEPVFSAWGWRFTTHRAVREFTFLTVPARTASPRSGADRSTSTPHPCTAPAPPTGSTPVAARPCSTPTRPVVCTSTSTSGPRTRVSSATSPRTRPMAGRGPRCASGPGSRAGRHRAGRGDLCVTPHGASPSGAHTLP